MAQLAKQMIEALRPKKLQAGLFVIVVFCSALNIYNAITASTECNKLKSIEQLSIGQLLEKANKGELERALIKQEQGMVHGMLTSGRRVVASVPENSQPEILRQLLASSVDTAFGETTYKNPIVHAIFDTILIPSNLLTAHCP
ncbi:hypothetical protein [Synechococcus sp. UW69]|uniref:hypothetical protein n=1 Tax=Synechococcus sp. UW69 TaxID=368493 RepID=UPI0010BD8781|nr:hypothetical protein [Synechococcus sp. UW69]